MARITLDHSKCRLCRLCIEYCPAYVFYQCGDKICFEEERCIECYGCIPLCPEKAISVEPSDC